MNNDNETVMHKWLKKETEYTVKECALIKLISGSLQRYCTDTSYSEK